MHVLVLGATGATGRLLVGQLLERGHRVRAVVRSRERMPEALRSHPALELVEAPVLPRSGANWSRLVKHVDGVACCLGHRLTAAGVFLPPWRLVTHAARRACEALSDRGGDRSARVVLMNSAGVRAPGEGVSVVEQLILGLLKLLVPPHADNEAAAHWLRQHGNDCGVEWVVLRPDGLHDAETATPVSWHGAPTRSALFHAGRTSRLNVAHAMADLLTDTELWERWRGASPVVYDAESS